LIFLFINIRPLFKIEALLINENKRFEAGDTAGETAGDTVGTTAVIWRYTIREIEKQLKGITVFYHSILNKQSER